MSWAEARPQQSHALPLPPAQLPSATSKGRVACASRAVAHLAATASPTAAAPEPRPRIPHVSVLCARGRPTLEQGVTRTASPLPRLLTPGDAVLYEPLPDPSCRPLSGSSLSMTLANRRRLTRRARHAAAVSEPARATPAAAGLAQCAAFH